MQNIKPILECYLNNTCSNEERLFVERWYNSIGSEYEIPANDEVHLEKRLWRKILQQLDNINDQNRTLTTEKIQALVKNKFFE